MATTLILLGSATVAFWGIMHLVKTRPVVQGFEPLTDDNRHVLEMEWIVEGVALIFVATLIAVFTLVQQPEAASSKLVYRMSSLFLLAMAIVSLFTGAKASPLPYKLCAPIFGTAALLVWVGSFLA